MRKTFSPYRRDLEEVLTSHGFSPSSLKIVESIRDYCAVLDPDGDEESDTRAAKCIRTPTGVQFLLSDGADPSDVMVALIVRRFDQRWIEALDSPVVFARHQLLHEIAHVVRAEIHRALPHDEIESDCDRWAFEKIGMR